MMRAAFALAFALALHAGAQAAPRARQCTAADIARYEALLGMHRGGLRTVPQLGFTVQYLGTVPRSGGVCAILLRRAD